MAHEVTAVVAAPDRISRSPRMSRQALNSGKRSGQNLIAKWAVARLTSMASWQGMILGSCGIIPFGKGLVSGCGRYVI